MESLDILILAVEASIAFAGFSGIIVTFQFSGEKEVRRSDAVGLTMILQFTLLAALISSMPLLLYTFDVKDTTMWAASSVFIAIMIAGGMYTAHMNLVRGSSKKFFRRFVVTIQFFSFGVVLMNGMNASDIFFHREAGPIFAGIIYALCVVGYFFSRLLLQPIWKSLRIQEAAKLAEAS